MTNTVALTKEKKEKKGIGHKRLYAIIIFSMLILMSLFILIPFYIIVLTSLMDNAESVMPGFKWWPEMGFHFDGYKQILFNNAVGIQGTSAIIRGFGNTLLVVVPACLIGLFTSALSAYSFAKINFPFKKLMFTILLLTMMIPGIIMLTPSYLLYDTLGLVDTFVPLMVPGMFGAAGCVFFLRQYFYAIPTDLIEAAKIDGLSHFGIFWKIMVPLSYSGLIAQGVLGFVGGYNDYMGPLIYLHSPERYTLQIALQFSIQTYGSDWMTVMASSVIALVPTVILYIFAQKFFIEGIATAGLKA